MYEALTGSDALILMTEWKQYRQPDFAVLKTTLKNAVIFDGRNQYDPKKIKELGFTYYCIGKKT